MTLPIWLQLLIYALAATRVTGLIVSDTIIEPARDRIIEALDNRPRTLGAFIIGVIECPWCAGMWVSLVASPLVWFWHASPLMLISALVLAFSQFIGMTASLGR
jgi:hypothetical protein